MTRWRYLEDQADRQYKISWNTGTWEYLEVKVCLQEHNLITGVSVVIPRSRPRTLRIYYGLLPHRLENENIVVSGTESLSVDYFCFCFFCLIDQQPRKRCVDLRDCTPAAVKSNHKLWLTLLSKWTAQVHEVGVHCVSLDTNKVVNPSTRYESGNLIFM